MDLWETNGSRFCRVLSLPYGKNSQSPEVNLIPSMPRTKNSSAKLLIFVATLLLYTSFTSLIINTPIAIYLNSKWVGGLSVAKRAFETILLGNHWSCDNLI